MESSNATRVSWGLYSKRGQIRVPWCDWPPGARWTRRPFTEKPRQVPDDWTWRHNEKTKKKKKSKWYNWSVADDSNKRYLLRIARVDRQHGNVRRIYRRVLLVIFNPKETWSHVFISPTLWLQQFSTPLKGSPSSCIDSSSSNSISTSAIQTHRDLHRWQGKLRMN